MEKVYEIIKNEYSYGFVTNEREAATIVYKLNEKIKKVGEEYDWSYVYEYIHREHKELLEDIDVLVDGPFMLAEKDISLVFKGGDDLYW